MKRKRGKTRKRNSEKEECVVGHTRQKRSEEVSSLRAEVTEEKESEKEGLEAENGGKGSGIVQMVRI